MTQKIFISKALFWAFKGRETRRESHTIAKERETLSHRMQSNTNRISIEYNRILIEHYRMPIKCNRIFQSFLNSY